MSVAAGKRHEELAAWPKLRALELLRSIESRSFATLPYFAIGAEEWASASEELIQAVLDTHLGPIVVVRSCAALKDTFAREPPGFFDSVLDVKTNAADLRWAIEKVIASYSRRPLTDGLPHKVVIQQQLLMPGLCGVCRVGPMKGGYIDIDYDNTLGRTDAVTAGVKAKRVVLSPCIDLLPAPWLQIRRCADELRDHFPAPFFIEFALNAAGIPTVFQIRSDRRSQASSETSLPPRSEELHDAATIIETFGPLSVMADWNPAEMLGLRPMPLDVSLYDELVMSGAWADGRMSIGWRKPSDRNLMTVVADRPYVKMALSLESLLPQGLPQRLADRLVRDRLAVLSANRQLHDKVEFRLMWSAFAFNQEAVDRDLRERGFSPEEVKQLFAALRTVTRQALEDAPRLLEVDRRGIAHLQAQRRNLASSAARRAIPAEAAQAIRAAMAICQTHGTVPFSRQARLAFTFRYIINHLVESGSVQADAIASWQSRLNTVTRQLSRDLARVQNGKKTEKFFFDRYGHLRPSTYNLESLRYDERALPLGEQPENTPDRPRYPGKSPRLAEILAELGTTCSQSQFWTAAAGAYKGREEIKFAFTALLSDILRTLAEIAKSAGLERRDLRCLQINDLLAAMEQANSWHDFGRLVAAWPSVRVPLWPRLRLPDVIFSSRDLHVVSEPDIRPTFVGEQVVSGVPCQVNGDSSLELGSFSGTIIAIETPDPGYDWVFANRIGGLITAYGGEFSHMGLRCAEFGISAALGCGPTLFTSAVKAAELRLDPTAGELWADGERLLPQ
jgi:hypothetical protein